jgi:hypothetical protein
VSRVLVLLQCRCRSCLVINVNGFYGNLPAGLTKLTGLVCVPRASQWGWAGGRGRTGEWDLEGRGVTVATVATLEVLPPPPH